MELTVNGRPGYVALPEITSKRGVIVLHEAFGLNADIRRIADRFAAEGYVAAAPNMFGGLRCLARTLSSEKRAADLDAWRDHLRAEHGVERVGIIGFCMGGGFALAHGAREGSEMRALSTNYGPLTISDFSHLCPVVASYGGRDRVMMPQARRLEKGLVEAGIDHDFKVYETAGHSFMNHHTRVGSMLGKSMGAAYDEAAAEDSWRRILAFFGERI